MGDEDKETTLKAYSCFEPGAIDQALAYAPYLPEEELVDILR
jgi:hypothetical protein